MRLLNEHQCPAFRSRLRNRRLGRSAELEQALYGWDGNVDSNALDVHVHNLRRKLYPGVIRTVRGVGYVADPPA